MAYKRRGRPPQTECPLCGGRFAHYLLNWHLAKYHDEGPPAALDNETTDPS